MRIIKGYDASALKKIAKNCNNKQIIKDVGYTGLVAYRNPEKVYCERLDDIAFFTGYHNSDHFRIIGIGVRKDQQGKGYGKFMLYRAINYARNSGHKK